MELIQLSLEDITPQEEAKDPCEGCTNKTCERRLRSHEKQ